MNIRNFPHTIFRGPGTGTRISLFPEKPLNINILAGLSLDWGGQQVVHVCLFGAFVSYGESQRCQNDSINKICFLEGVGEGENLQKIVPKCCFSWEISGRLLEKERHKQTC